MNRKLASVMFGIAAFAVAATFTNSASAQWRTHYVHRDGLFHVERLHTGNGLTPVGGAVLMTGINAFAPIVGDVLKDTRDMPSTTRERSTLDRDRLADELESARRLLERTASLVDYRPASGGGGGGGGDDTAESEEPVGMGSNPWKSRPSSGTSSKPQKPQSGASNTPDGKSPFKKRPN